MEDDKLRILRLLEEKKISADEAERLLSALANSQGPAGRNRFIKIKVVDKETDKTKVNITVPMALVRWGMKMAPRDAKAKIEEHEIDLKMISEALEKGLTGKIVDVDDETKGEHVEVWLE
jgi:hypothetical protein